MKIMVVWFLLCSLSFHPYIVQSDENYEFEHHLCTKTPYRVINNIDSTEVRYEGCVAKKLWSVIRHGTRTPGDETASLMRTRLFVIRDRILENHKNCSKYTNFVDWKPHHELDNKKRLTVEGESEMIFLGERMRQRFPEILSTPWNNASYLFRFTDTSRTNASARHFARGLFGVKGFEDIWYPSPLKKDPILRFYKLCQKWRMEIKKNQSSLIELNAFLRSELFSMVVANVTKRFNFREDEITIDDIQLIYTTCCFETAWDKSKTSPWCHVLSSQEFEILEYAEDLEYYWIDGYGYELTTKMGCVMFRDVLSKLKSKNEQKAVFYFTHSGTILKFLSYLGLYRDSSKLLHDNFIEQTQRLWKTSHIDTFASNIAFVLFNCHDGDYLLTLHQEKPVILPGCPTDRNLCPLNRVEQLYEESQVQCDFDSMCNNANNESLMKFVIDKLWFAYDSLMSFYFN